VNYGLIANSVLTNVSEISIGGTSRNVNISNITVYNASGSGIAFDGNTSNSEIKDSKIINTRKHGIMLNIYGTGGIPSKLKLINNTIIDVGRGKNGEGMAILGVSFSIFEDNFINGSGKEGYDIENTSSSIFRRNRVTGAHWDGFFFDWHSYNITVEDCESFGNNGGVNIWKSSHITFSNCMIHSNKPTGIRIENGTFITIKNSRIFDNTGYCGVCSYNSSHIALENNTIDQTYPYVFYTPYSGLNTTIENYNVYFFPVNDYIAIKIKEFNLSKPEGYLINYSTQGNNVLTYANITPIARENFTALFNSINYSYQNGILNYVLNASAIGPTILLKKLNAPMTITKSDATITSVDYNISSNKFNFTADCIGEKTAEIYIPNKPSKIIVNGTVINYDDGLTLTPSWKYDETNKLVTVKFNCE
jgi:hypothetical protein